ncbi:hypothetical protein [Campylobacter concisus]|uniref:Uncharacterized protein n=1 Tax=Campylobacter concisus TaxID=199 RepID=A0A7S9X4Y9_9BACT|nr:hypothetical protein [Campylobacter concisus]QPH97523.1 hypothetical protein CVS89_04430 [Campylobacter concisus]QPI04720.1 hypothetical protein G5B99_04240 [Campylobacter concisus]
MQLKNYGKFYLSRQISIWQILKFYERAYHASKFSGEYLMSPKFSKLLRRVSKVLNLPQDVNLS